ncbi:GNAT family N-acetyltransferase [Shewanella cyperi]|uniref:Protein ElaA n=1 Tax=Shewanella cyperi TaxID=2814292 RepID=A0A975AMW6_9GAMM|nr:GNAT family N-acetyltransferase [Shewanella cyperi]QSX31743.1 GNAT family N-acetyltransferase [Shewanella cyperi]
MHWQSLRFDQLDTLTLYRLLKLRVDVFVVEQTCPYPELDDKDLHPDTLHLLALDDGGQPLAYARLLPPGLSYRDASIGRVAVAASARGAGLAGELMQRAISQTLANWPEYGITIGAQDYLRGFYSRLGFKANSEVYLEDGIPHLDMHYQQGRSL